MPHRLPDRLPIVARHGGRVAWKSRELTAPVDLCDAAGNLNPAAVGWSRRPLVRANLHGHWPRKKRWNFWNWIAPRFVFSVTLADVDYGAFCQASLFDFDTARSWTSTTLARPGSLDLPEAVERTVRFRSRRTDYANVLDGRDMRVAFRGTAGTGEPIAADFVVRTPLGHESLTMVVPWTARRFQLNSKHAALPCEGVVRVGDADYAMRPDECHGVQDWGRGVWPYRSFWNWGVATGTHDGVRVGVNVGAKWTTGTGVTENGLFVDGRLHRIDEELRWDYDAADWMRPWRVRADSGVVDLALEPVFAHRPRMNVGFLATGGVCCFGRWHGAIRVDGREMRLRDLVGWAEEFSHRW